MNEKELFDAIFQAGLEELPWVQEIYTCWHPHGNTLFRCDLMQIELNDPDAAVPELEQPLVFRIKAEELMAARNYAIQEKMVDRCTGQPIGEADMDVCVADLIVQLACFGQEIYT